MKRHVSQREAVTNSVLAFDCKICWKCGFSLKLIYENDIFCSAPKLPLIGLLTCMHKVLENSLNKPIYYNDKIILCWNN